MDQEIKSICDEFLGESNPKIIKEVAGENSTVYLIKIKNKKFALRKKRSETTEEQLLFESNFLEKLNKKKLPVRIPQIIKTKRRKPFIKRQGTFFTLFTFLEGEKKYEWYSDNIPKVQIARGYSVFAQLHNIQEKITIKKKKKGKSLIQLLTLFQKNVKKVGMLPEGKVKSYAEKKQSMMQEEIAQIKKELKEQNYKSIKVIPTQYDFHFGNVLFKNNKPHSLLDFDWAQHTTREWDFCRSCMMLCGTFNFNNNKDALDNTLLKLALKSYNAKAKRKLTNIPLLQTLMKATSFFIINWCIETTLKEKRNEGYYLSFFTTGIKRLENTKYKELFL